jgi:hypothetical protein
MRVRNVLLALLLVSAGAAFASQRVMVCEEITTVVG